MADSSQHREDTMTDKRRKWTDEEIDLVTRESAAGRWPYEIAPMIGRSPGEVADLKRRYCIKRLKPEGRDTARCKIAPRITLSRCAARGADKSLPCPVPRCERYAGDEYITERTLAGVTGAL
jgi:hypothetical protein